MGSDQVNLVSRQSLKDFNPRSPDGERLAACALVSSRWCISIHAPRMGSDYPSVRPHTPIRGISIHAPRMGSDQHPIKFRDMHVGFQSTLPGWGATLYHAASRTTVLFQSTLPGWGATRDTPKSGRLPYNFNPRSPDGERHDFRHRHPQVKKFQSTLPGWGATLGGIVAGGEYLDFNPRSPDGERLWYAQSADC